MGLLEMFSCEKRSMTLSTAGCSRLYAKANESSRPPDPWLGLSSCRACPVGAFHTTGVVQNPMMALTEAIRLVCPRCFRPSEGLINEALCRSCDARHGEALRRKDARGKVPSLSARLHTQRIVVSAGFVSRIVTQRSVIGLQEVILRHSKAATSPLAFGPRHLQWPGVRQLEMAL